MAKLRVLGDTIQIESDLTEVDFKKVQNYAPEALKLKDEQGNEVFGISLGDAHWSKYGIAFCNTNADGKLFMTTNNPVTQHDDPAAEKKAIKELFATVLFNLESIEKYFGQIKTELDAIEQEAERNIEMN